MSKTVLNDNNQINNKNKIIQLYLLKQNYQQEPFQFKLQCIQNRGRLTILDCESS